MQKPVLLASGGIDSYITWHYLEKPQVIFVDYDQPYINIERQAIHKLYDNVVEIKISGLKPLTDIYVPARNLMLASLALRHSNLIAMGGVKDEICRDKSPKAFKTMSAVLTMFNKTEVTVYSPIWHMTKSDAVKWYIDSGLDINNLHDTVSCYSSDLCNNCESCFRRFVALAVNDVIEKDRLPADRIIKKYIRTLHIQPHGRDRDIVRALLKIKEPLEIDSNIVKYKGVIGKLKE